MDDSRDTERLPLHSNAQTISPPAERTSSVTDDGVRLEGPAGRIVDPDKPKPRSRKWSWFRSILALVVLAVPLFVLLIAGAVYWQARTDEAGPADAIVVLGAAQYNGRPSPVLSARLDHALALYDRDLAPLIILTGGRAEGDAYSEAEAGRLYLEERGVPSSAMAVENEGRDTFTSMQGVDEVLA
ncbi:MAG: YdcF family protein, partial [Chloroflexia bacterium]|nr:YdcF family protein [Chloroflexia bacterium]